MALAAVAVWGFYATTGKAVGFEMIARDKLLVIFFAAVGINSRLSDLLSGGRALAATGGRESRPPKARYSEHVIT